MTSGADNRQARACALADVIIEAILEDIERHGDATDTVALCALASAFVTLCDSLKSDLAREDARHEFIALIDHPEWAARDPTFGLTVQ